MAVKQSGMYTEVPWRVADIFLSPIEPNQINGWNKNNKSPTPKSKDKTHDASDNN